MTDTLATLGDAEAIIDTAIRAAEPKQLEDEQSYAYVVPEGHKVEVIHCDHEQYLDQPRRKKGTVVVVTADSLVAYVKDHDEHDGRTHLFANIDQQEVVAVLNGPNAEPGWGDHKAILRLALTPAWKRWAARDGRIGSQVEFAEHIEDCLTDIADPAGADLLELAQTFQASVAAEFKSGARLANGQRQLTYVESIDAKAGQNGTLVIPETFTLSLAPIEGSDPVIVTARLRYRLGGDKGLSIGYILHRPDVVLRDAFDSVLAKVETGTGITAYRGWVA